ncbi:NnrS family protein [Thalassospira alkalitolerans]|uniref:NnrS family protein n=1 Tax=Thalassospira alkalitolerans TaxID=1293890 RepID=UPI0030ED5726|tara:strand:- start:33213 stop:34352 length:1140 start_codon:yes stop_codon:yes gene_type:complete
MTRPIRTDFITLFVLSGCLAAITISLKALSWVSGDAYGILAWLIPAGSFWHGHEMLSGYAQGLLAGYLMTKASRQDIAIFIALWLGARIAVFAPAFPGLYLAAVCNLSVIALLFYHAGLMFFRAAKRFRSAIPGIVILLLTVAELMFQVGLIMDLPRLCETALLGVIWLLIIMLFLMGGRITAAATSGVLQRRNAYRHGLAQSRYETYGLVALATALFSELLGQTPWLTDIAALSTATIMTLRLLHWQIWKAWDQLDVSSLHLGYAMLAMGLFFKAFWSLSGHGNGLVSFHGVMIGGFGILSITVMTRTVLQRLRHPIVLPITIRFCNLALVAAAFIRITDFYVQTPFLISSSAVLWTLAFITFVSTLIIIRMMFHRQN